MHISSLLVFLSGFLGLSTFIIDVAHGQTDELPDPDVVIRNYIDALGSEMALLGLQSLRITGTFSGPKSGTMHFNYHDGKSRLDFNEDNDQAKQITYAFDGQFGWHRINDRNTLQLYSGGAEDNNRESSTTPTMALYWADYPGKIRTVGRVEVDESEAFHLEFTSPNGTVFDRYFDVESKLLIKSTYNSRTGTATITNTYQYQEVGGIQFLAKKSQFHSDDYSYEYTYDKVEMNVDVDESIFEVPKELADEVKHRLANKDQTANDDDK